MTCPFINFSSHAKKRRYLSPSIDTRGLISRRRPLTAVITFNRLAICAARVSTADRIKRVEDITIEKCNRSIPMLHSSAIFFFFYNIENKTNDNFVYASRIILERYIGA